MPIPGVLGITGSAAACVSPRWPTGPPRPLTAGAALAVLVVWLVVYLRISAPITAP